MAADRDLGDERRRMILAAGGAAGIAAAVSSIVPFVRSMAPSERTKAAGAPVEVDISGLAAGQLQTINWRGKPVWILRRTPEMLASLQDLAPQLADPDSQRSLQPDSCRNLTRSVRPDVLVTVGVCTHLGCSPKTRFTTGVASGIAPDWPGGFYCPCHGSTFDLAGRVYKDKLAPTNLEVPPHRFAGDARLVIGEEDSQA